MSLGPAGAEAADDGELADRLDRIEAGQREILRALDD